MPSFFIATNLVGIVVVLLGVVDGVAAGVATAAARGGGRRLQDLQMVIGEVDPYAVRGLVAVEVVGACRVWRQCMART